MLYVKFCLELTLFILTVPNETKDISYKLNYQDIRLHKNYHLIDQECGSSFSNRIFGGTEAELGQYPWIARVLSETRDVKKGTKTSYSCGGSIINNRYVLTAAHCILTPKESITVVLGEYRKSTDPDCVSGVCAPPVQKFGVEEIITHDLRKQYNGSELAPYDISLLRLNRTIIVNDYVEPICLPTRNVSITNQWAEIAGWGKIESDVNNRPDILRVVRMKILPYEYCKTRYNRSMTFTLHTSNEIMNTQFCAGDVKGQDSCEGDSGGPVMMPLSLDEIPRYYVIGIVSFGPIDCHKTPGFYTNVFIFVEWILDNIKN